MKLTGTKRTVVAANFMIDARRLVVVAARPGEFATAVRDFLAALPG